MLKRSTLKWKLLEIFECSSQILSNSLCQFWNKSIPLQILCPSSVSWNITPLYFFTSNNMYYAHTEPIRVKILETFFESSGQIFSNFLCQFWNHESIPLQILYHSSVSWIIIALYFLISNNIYFAQNEPIKLKILENFECSSHILSNSLYRFWNNKSIALQILYLSSVSW